MTSSLMKYLLKFVLWRDCHLRPKSGLVEIGNMTYENSFFSDVKLVQCICPLYFKFTFYITFICPIAHSWCFLFYSFIHFYLFILSFSWNLIKDFLIPRDQASHWSWPPDLDAQPMARRLHELSVYAPEEHRRQMKASREDFLPFPIV